MAGRFDLQEPEGTCYLAEDEVCALLEILALDLEGSEGSLVSQSFLDARRIWTVKVPREMSLADLVSRRAAGFGITAEIGSMVPYELPQAWAARLHSAGAEGLVYWLRHDPSGTLGFAIFGPHGEHHDWPTGQGQPIGQDLVLRLRDECAIEVSPIPASGELTILGD